VDDGSEATEDHVLDALLVEDAAHRQRIEHQPVDEVEARRTPAWTSSTVLLNAIISATLSATGIPSR